AADSRLCESLKRAAAERALRDARQRAAPARELQQALEPAGPAPSRAQRLGKLAERQVPRLWKRAARQAQRRAASARRCSAAWRRRWCEWPASVWRRAWHHAQRSPVRVLRERKTVASEAARRARQQRREHAVSCPALHRPTRRDIRLESRSATLPLRRAC